MKRNFPNAVGRDVLLIMSLAVIFAFVYNSFSAHGIPFLRVEPKTIGVSDSALFLHEPLKPAGSDRQSTDTSVSSEVKVVAPLHERALRNADSMKAIVQSSPETENVYRIITLEQLKRLRAQRRGLLFDARTAADYRISRIRGARNIPGEEAEDHFSDVADLPRDTLIIIYCNNTDCHLGRVLAEFLKVVDFKNVFLYNDGWDGWLKAKEPIDTSRVVKGGF